MQAARIVLGVGGGIAAYKAAILVRLLTEHGHDVSVVPTEASLRFVGQATWEALSGNAVTTSVFDEVPSVRHVLLGKEADLVVVAPATADILARAASGQADDLLTATLLMAHGRVMFVPAMHTQMWQHPATVANVALLRSRGAVVMDPEWGRLTGEDSGVGRFPDPERIMAQAFACLAVEGREPFLQGKKVLVTLGGTREPWDPVRYCGNHSSGKQGMALVYVAQALGAEVSIIAAHVEVPLPRGTSVEQVSTAEAMQRALNERAGEAEVIIMAAAVADFRPAHPLPAKLKKTEQTAVMELVRNPDLLHGVVQQRQERGRRQVIVGFAAETGDDAHGVLDYGRHKLKTKGCDMLVVNQVGSEQAPVFGRDATVVTILDASDVSEPCTVGGEKTEVAVHILARVGDHLRTRLETL